MQEERPVKIQPLSGFPEFLPAHQLTFDRIRSGVEDAYRRCGFVPLETPAVERWEILVAKGGIQKQIYSVGKPRPRSGATATQMDMFDFLNPEMGLRFDLTVPLARYVVQHSNDLSFPFRRYQIQPVWRGERAQKGRFRQFYQADVDIVGRSRLDPLYDAEIVAVIVRALEAIEGLPDFKIHLSNRKILAGLLADFGIADASEAVLREIDKTARDGLTKVLSSIRSMLAGAPTGFMETLSALLQARTGSLDDLRKILNGRAQALAGIEELAKVFDAAVTLGVPCERLAVDPTIARGLDYYTGTVFETFVSGREEWGSIASGGRYEDLASTFGAQRFPGVGGSIGLSRLADILFSNNLLPTDTATTADVLVTTLDRENFLGEYLAITAELRAAGIACEVFLQKTRLGNQLGYASKMGFKYAVIAGETEFHNASVNVRDMRTKEEVPVGRSRLAEYLSGKLHKDKSDV